MVNYVCSLLFVRILIDEGDKLMTLWNKVKIFKIFVQLVLNPNRTDLIFKGVDIVSQDPNQPVLKGIENLVLSDAEFHSMYQTKYIPHAPALDELKNLPAGTFGRAVFDHMNQNHLDFSLWPTNQADRPIQYLSARIYQDHDLWHALLGYGVEVEDELAIQGFGVAQFQSPIGLMLIAGGLIHLMMKDPRRALKAFARVNETYALGKRVPFLLAQRLHNHFSRPLTEVRQICGLAT